MPADRRFMIILFAVALGIRVLFGITAESLIGVGPGTETRSLLYAEQIVSGVSWIASPVSSQSPGYPFLLAIFYLVAFKQIWLVFVLQSAMSALTVLLLYRMAVPSVGRLLAAVAALWLTLHYLHLQLTSIFVRDTLVVLLLLVVTCLLMRPFKRMRFAAFTGVSYAALLHVDPQYMLLFPVFAFVIFFKANRRFLNLQYLFVFITATMVVCLPWTIRNQVVYRQPIPFGLEAARYFKPLKIFVYEPARTASEVQSRVEGASRTRRVENNAIEFWRVARFRDGTALGEARQDPNARVEPAWSARHNLASIVTFGLLLPFLLVGTVTAVRRRRERQWMIALVIVFYFLMRAWLGGSERTRLPIEPLIILLAFYGVSVVLEKFTRKSRPVIASGTETPR